MTKGVSPETCRGVCRGERLVNWTGAWRKHYYAAFTLIELIVVVGIITILAGLLLSTADYARKKGACARAETEIAAISAACENYKADNGIYPREATTTILSRLTTSGRSVRLPRDASRSRQPIQRQTPIRKCFNLRRARSYFNVQGRYMTRHEHDHDGRV